MQLILKRYRGLLLALCLQAGNAWGTLPDPAEFGWIVERGDVREIRQWLDEGLAPEFMGSETGTGLMIAAWNGNIELMALFVQHGANPRRRSKRPLIQCNTTDDGRSRGP